MNKKLRMLLDLDDTISIFIPTCIKKYNEIYGTNHSIDEITKWDISGIFEHDLWSIFDKCDVLEHMPLKEGAFETIEKWHNQGHQITIVTGVNDIKSYEDKIKWLKNIGLDKYIYDIIPTKNKELLSGDILVDDNPEYLRKFQKTNPDALCLLMTAQHNKGKDYSDEFIRIHSWHELSLLVELLTRVVE